MNESCGKASVLVCLKRPPPHKLEWGFVDKINNVLYIESKVHCWKLCIITLQLGMLFCRMSILCIL